MSDTNETPLDRALDYPFDLERLFQKKKALRRLLSERTIPFLNRRVAILGGSTTTEVRDMLELFLLRDGIRPTFYESDFNRYVEDVMFEHPPLLAFQPEIVILYTSWRNLQQHPAMQDAPDQVREKLEAEAAKAPALWEKLNRLFPEALVIQNNVELPPFRLLGNLDGSDPRGEVHFVESLNQHLVKRVSAYPHVRLHDLHYQASAFGLDRWHDPEAWHAYKYACAVDAIPRVAHSLSRMIGAACGKGRKVVVVDLDNTLWGGVIADDGLEKIQIGRETAEAEAFTAFQAYLKELRSRGILLAVASKNNPSSAVEGLNHPEGLLKPDDFISIQAHWNPKDQSLRTIAQEAALGVDSFVFVDDNPTERDWVRSQVPGAAVPDVGSQVSRFAHLLDREGYFEPGQLSAEDLQRSRFYQENQERAVEAQKYASYDDFLVSLEMNAQIAPFSPVYLDRIAQLINKSNQFNLTTRRMTLPEVQALTRDPQQRTFYGKLKDRFGDHGLVSIVIARVTGKDAVLDVWLMSCRVLKRRMEHAMLQAVIRDVHTRGVERLIGEYVPTAKNVMVKEFYKELGFSLIDQQADGRSRWSLSLAADPPILSGLPMTLEEPA